MRRWSGRYAELVAHIRDAGRLPSYRAAAGSDERRLYAWLAAQRALERKGRLEPARVAMLERVGALAATRERHWWTRYRHVRDFVAAHGRLPREKAADPDERRLGVWLGHVRKAARHGRLADDRLAALAALVPAGRAKAPRTV